MKLYEVYHIDDTKKEQPSYIASLVVADNPYLLTSSEWGKGIQGYRLSCMDNIEILTQNEKATLFNVGILNQERTDKDPVSYSSVLADDIQEVIKKYPYAVEITPANFNVNIVHVKGDEFKSEAKTEQSAVSEG